MRLFNTDAASTHAETTLASGDEVKLPCGVWPRATRVVIRIVKGTRQSRRVLTDGNLLNE